METTTKSTLLTATLLTATMAAAWAQKPNIIIIMADQQRADMCAREGFGADLTPVADSLARLGAWFNRAYTSAPASVPARTSLLTGRFPKATEVDSNHNTADAKYEDSIFSTARQNGYTTALVGKNHSFLRPEMVDYWNEYGHNGAMSKSKSEEGKEVDEFLKTTQMYFSEQPAPGGEQGQPPYRMVRQAAEWIEEQADNQRPFVMWLSFAEPHNPYQVCEPYYSMFADNKAAAETTDTSVLAKMDLRYDLLHRMMNQGHKGMDKNLQRIRANYMGMIRLLDTQQGWLMGELHRMGIDDNTIVIIMADHGDYAGRYGLMKKGVGMSDALTRIPMVWYGGGVKQCGLRDDHVSIVDLYPTLCEAMGAAIPVGVQGRSLWPMLTGNDYPKAEFASVMSEGGYGGQYYTEQDGNDFVGEGAIRAKGLFFDCLNTWTQSGSERMVRKGDWKLVFDMQGNGQLYNLGNDPMELRNLYDKRRYRAKRDELTAELLRWEIATQDPLPVPHTRYIYKRFPHNYLFNER